jgi:dihydroxyacetone kinase-like predicted kinase
MTARQALDLTAKHVAVVPSKSVPQGIAAMLALTPDGDFETSVATMTKALSTVKTGEVTIATRSVEMDGVDVKEGQVIGLLNGRLAVAGDDPESVTLEMLAQAGVEEAELVTLYYGADLSVMRANQLADKIRERFPKQEVELIEGGQPHYQLIFSVE